jgi:hypothetical protein
MKKLLYILALLICSFISYSQTTDIICKSCDNISGSYIIGNDGSAAVTYFNGLLVKPSRGADYAIPAPYTYWFAGSLVYFRLPDGDIKSIRISSTKFRIRARMQEFLTACNCGGGPAERRLHENMIYVDPNGDNANAVKGDPMRSWETFDEAVNNIDNFSELSMFKGAYTLGTSLTLPQGSIALDFQTSSLSGLLPGNSITLLDSTSLKIEGQSITLLGVDAEQKFIVASTDAINVDIDVTLDSVYSVAPSVSTWGRGEFIRAYGNSLNLDIDRVTFWGSTLFNSYCRVNTLKFGNVLIPENGGADAGRFDEGVMIARGPSPDTLSGSMFIDVGLFYNERTDAEKGFLVIASKAFKAPYTFDIKVDEYRSNAIRTSMRNVNYTGTSKASFYEYDFGNGAGTADSLSINIDINKVTGNYTYAAFAGNDLSEDVNINTAVVDESLFFGNYAVSASATARLSNSKFNYEYVECDGMPVVLIKAMRLDSSYYKFSGAKWNVNGDIGMSISKLEIDSGSTFSIDVGELVSDNIVLNFTDLDIAATGKLIISGSFKTNAAATAAIQINSGTIAGDIILEDATFINDATVASIQSAVAVNIICKNVFSNSAIADGDVTELVEAVTRNANVK